jgi:hypothetical protein
MWCYFWVFIWIRHLANQSSTEVKWSRRFWEAILGSSWDYRIALSSAKEAITSCRDDGDGEEGREFYWKYFRFICE